MPRPLAFLLTAAVVFYLFRRDVREKPPITGALWLPLIWFLIAGSRFVSQWLGVSGGATVEDGSPIDRVIFLGLIVGGFFVLKNRHVRLSEVLRNNVWLTIYFFYCFVAIFWSDYQFVSFKRWFKTFGEPIMVLIIFSEPDPAEALTRLMKRAAYILMPFSIMLIKYFPETGRGFSQWGGAVNVGVTLDKNMLGADCLVLGFFLFCHLLTTLNLEKSRVRRNELLLTGFLLWMVWWTLIESASSTALMALVVGMVAVWTLGRGFVVKRFVGVYIVLGVAALVAADAAFGLFDVLVGLLGEDSTLTGRTELWDYLLAMKTNPAFGVGFESFWLGERLDSIQKVLRWRPNEAHNGYLETYLQLGLVGLGILLSLIIATYRKSRRALQQAFESGRMRLSFLAAVVVYNWTESSFRTLHVVLLGFYLIALDYTSPKAASGVAIGGTRPADPDRVSRRSSYPHTWSPTRPTAGRAARSWLPTKPAPR
jgi:O-antigen ligase